MDLSIKNISGTVLYTAEATSIRELLELAAKDLSDLYGADLRGANLCDSDLYGANLRGADLRGANLYAADLYGANLYRSNLCGANLRGSNLCGANLRGADLRGADLRGADLYGADLRGADLRWANLDPDKLPAIQIGGSRDWITMLGAEDVRIGCQHHTLEWWLEHYAAVGRSNNYTAAQVVEYKAYLDMLAAQVSAAKAYAAENGVEVANG